MELTGIGSGVIVTGASDATDDFVDVYRLHYPRLVRVLTLAGATPAEAEDAAQEAFARSLRHWARVRRGPNPAGYPYRVGFRLLKGQKRPRDWTETPVPADRPDETAIAACGVEQTLAALPPRQRQCAVCCFVLGFTPLEAARLLGIKPATVRKHLDGARSAFAAMLRA